MEKLNESGPPAAEVTGWISLQQVAGLLGVSIRTARRLADDGRFGTRQLPGCRVRYSRSDALEMAAASTTARKA